MKSGDDLQKPPAIVMAPTANAAYIVNGKTVESALGIIPRNENAYQLAWPSPACNPNAAKSHHSQDLSFPI